MTRLGPRRLAVAILAVYALMTALAAGAGARTSVSAEPAGSAAPVQLDFWNYWEGNNGKAIASLVQQFNRSHPNIRVRNVSFPWGDLFSKM